MARTSSLSPGRGTSPPEGSSSSSCELELLEGGGTELDEEDVLEEALEELGG